MKKIITITALIASLSVVALADKHQGKHDGVVALPHLMKIIIANGEKLKIDEKQQEKFDTILQEVPALMHTLMNEAKELENSIKKDIMMNKKTNEDVKTKIEKLQKLEYKISTQQIKTINRLQEILSDEQYKKVIEILHTKNKNKKSC